MDRWPLGDRRRRVQGPTGLRMGEGWGGGRKEGGRKMKGEEEGGKEEKRGKGVGEEGSGKMKNVGAWEE